MQFRNKTTGHYVEVVATGIKKADGLEYFQYRYVREHTVVELERRAFYDKFETV